MMRGARVFADVAAKLGKSAALALLAAALLWTMPAAANSPTAVVPYRIDYDGWYTVPVFIDGEGPYDFIVDSGATVTVVFRKLADRRAMKLTGRPPRRILGLVGSEKLPVYRIGDVAVGGATLPSLLSVVIEDWPDDRATPDGVLGLDLLSRYTVLFDARRQVIEFHSPVSAPLEGTARWARTDLIADDFGQGAGELYRFTARVGPHRIPFVLDLGAAGTIINYSALRRMMSGVHIDGTRDSGFSTGTRLNDIFSETDVARLARIRLLRVGAASWRNLLYIVFDAPIFEELGVDRRPFGFFGSDNFTDRSFVADFPNGELRIGPEERRPRQGMLPDRVGRPPGRSPSGE